MVDFTSESLSVFLTVIVFALLLGIVLWFIPQYTDMMIGVIEASVI